MQEKRRSGWIHRLLLGLVLALGALGMRTSVQAASVVKSTAAYTLYSDGKLVVHDSTNTFEDYYDEERNIWTVKCKDILDILDFSRSIFKTDVLSVNPNVTDLVLEENPVTYWKSPLILFPNLKTITGSGLDEGIMKEELVAGKRYNAFSWGKTYTSNWDNYNDMKTVVDYWNSHYDSKLAIERVEPKEGYSYSTRIYSVPSKDLCIITYDVGDRKEMILEQGYSFKALTCKLDSSQGSSLGTVGSAVYDGKAHGAEIEEGLKVGCENGHVLNSGEQCAISYYNQATKKKGDTTSAGTVKVTVKGINGHTGTLTGTYTIGPQTLTKGNITLSKAGYTYDGKAKKPAVTVKNAAGKTLKEKTDYTVSYSSNVNAGTATVTIKGKGNYTGTVKKTFQIAKAKQAISLKTAKKSCKEATLAKKSASFTIGASAKTKLTYKSSSKKYVTVTSRGKVTVKKGTPKGTYTVTVTAAAAKNYKSAAKTVKITVK